MRRLKIVVISANYPGPDLPFGEVFVHARLKEYQKFVDVAVVGFNPGIKKVRDYTYEGVQAFITPDLSLFQQRIADANPDAIVAHLVSHEYLPFLVQLAKPMVIFVHGYEALSWRRRLGNYSWKSLHYLAKYVQSNLTQRRELKKFVHAVNERSDVQFVFVSEWLMRAAQADLDVRITRAQVISNPINTTLFHGQPKTEGHRKKVLLIRSFKARNYANDISVDAIVQLSKKNFFKDIEFAVYGEGYLFESLTRRVQHFSNVKTHNHFIENRLVPEIHQPYGIFLCPSRLDTQGVSMCEAMSGGLVPITSPIGGIPEYAQDGKSAFLCRDAKAIADRIEYLYFHPEQFMQMSVNAREEIMHKCSHEHVIPRELAVISSVIAVK